MPPLTVTVYNVKFHAVQNQFSIISFLHLKVTPIATASHLGFWIKRNVMASIGRCWLRKSKKNSLAFYDTILSRDILNDNKKIK